MEDRLPTRQEKAEYIAAEKTIKYFAQKVLNRFGNDQEIVEEIEGTQKEALLRLERSWAIHPSNAFITRTAHDFRILCEIYLDIPKE